MQEKDWVDILSALLTPTIAIAGVYFAWSNRELAQKKHQDDFDLAEKKYQDNFDLAQKKHHDDLDLAQKKREDDLFDRRYALFEKIIALWLCYKSVVSEPSKDHPFPFDREEMGSLVFKVGFLFDEEIELVVNSMMQFILSPPTSDCGVVPDTIDNLPRELFEKFLKIK